MRGIELKLDSRIGYTDAEKAAKEAASDFGDDLSLLAWYDRVRNMGAPQEACSLESWKCVRDYAEHHEADIRVSVNDDAYEFFFAATPVGTVQLDREEVVEVHEGISRDEFDNIQGG